MIDRRRFLSGAFGAGVLAGLPSELLAMSVPDAPSPGWDPGRLRHLLPTVGSDRIRLKASFREAVGEAPILRVGGRSAPGRATDTRGLCWSFDVAGLPPGREQLLELRDGAGSSLCEPWSLRTFPDPASTPERCRVLFFTCAGGHDAMQFLPTPTRQRLLRRALALAPDAVVANGDHVYWDLLAPKAGPYLGGSALAEELAGRFDRSALVFGHDNETVLTRAAGPQIADLYGTAFRSTPVFFLRDDHDYFDNDEATDSLVTFPPSHFMRSLARATQQLYYPEFLGDPTRPDGLPGSRRTVDGLVGESFGTLRYGKLVEVLLYDVRRTMTLAGPSAVFLDPEVERWLTERSSTAGATHLVHAPSSPSGWSAGKWGEWYPDALGEDGVLGTARAKAYWQRGWLAQHDRILAAMAARPDRAPLMVSGDLHALALARIRSAGDLDLSANPVTTVLSGPIGTGPLGWPSAFRGVGPGTPRHLSVEEAIAPIEEHGFTMVDFLPDRMRVQLFRWSVADQAPEAIDTLEPFHVEDIALPG